MRIIGISGIWSDDHPVWHVVGPAFRKAFKSETFILEEEIGCDPWEIPRLRAFVHKLALKYDDEVDTVLVGHSMGGIIACAVAARMQRTKIRGVTTIFSPNAFMFRMFPRLLRVGITPVPIVSFGARIDGLVWWGSRHPAALHHEKLRSNHLSRLVGNEELAAKIASISEQYFMRT